MRTKFRLLIFGIVTALVGTASAQYPYYVTVSGHVNQCTPMIADGFVTIYSGIGVEPTYATQVDLNENCYYTYTFGVNTPSGTFLVNGICMNGTATDTAGSYFAESMDPVFLTLDLACTTTLDCENVLGGQALPGTPCNDGDPETYFDTWSPNCECLGGADQDTFITVSGTVVGCTGAGLPVHITSQGFPWVDHTVLTDANCGYSYTFYSMDETGTIEVNTSCNGGITQVVANAPWTSNPSNVNINLQCQGNSTYLVHVQGQVSPCDLLDNTVTVRCTSCNPWVETVVPVDANCNYSATLEVASLTGTIAVITGCSNGLVPNNAMQYIVNEQIGETSLTLNLSCEPGPAEACFVAQQVAPFTAIFTNCSTGCLPPLTFLWDFSDGGTIEGDLITHTFAPGTFGVCLNVAGSDGCVASICHQVYVDGNGNVSLDPPAACNACFTVSQTGSTPIFEGTPWSMTFSNCTSGGSSPYAFDWMFSDGTVSNLAEPTFEVSAEGTYIVCLSIVDVNGCESSTCDSIYVDENGTINPNNTDPCYAGFFVMQAYQWVDSAANPNGGGGEPIPNELWLWNLSGGGTGNFQFQWSWGDGSGSSEAFPSHTYASGGTYSICLTVNDNAGCTNTYCQDITVDGDGILDGFAGDGNRSTFTIRVMNPLTTGITELPTITGLNAWPNPVNEVLNITLESRMKGNLRIAITDLSGRVVATDTRAINDGRNTLTVPVSELNAGLYLITIGNGTTTVSERFVKVR